MTSPCWEASYPAGLSWSGPLPAPIPLQGILKRAADKWPNRIAIDFYDQTLTFRNLLTLSACAAKGLQQVGVGPNVNVALHLPNTPHFLICFFGILLAGGRVANVSSSGGLDELKLQLADSNAKVLVTAQWLPIFSELKQLDSVAALNAVVVCRLTDFLSSSVADTLVKPSVRHSPPLANALEFRRMVANDGLRVRHSLGKLEDEVAVLQYTGGTTGEPKGAMLTHANFSAVIYILTRWAAAQSKQAGSDQAPRFTETVSRAKETRTPNKSSPGSHPRSSRRKVLGVVPLNHIYGLSAILLPTLFSGNELVLHLRFDAGRVMADIAGKRISRFSGVPAMFASLVSHSAFRNSDFSSLMSWGTGGAPLPLELRQELEAVSSRGLAEGYALTETTGLATLPISSNAIDRVGQVGIPAPLTTIEVVDLTTGMELLPVGEVGEICISGPQVMKGYWNRPSDNLQAFRGGRFHTGDVGYIDARGRVTLTERKKDMLLVGAHNVYPRNIERAIQAHPDVAEVAVIGVPNKDFGQIPKAILVLKPDSAPLTHRELCLFLAKRLAAHELPGTIEIRSELPKTAMGKISKLTLMEEEVART